MRLCRPKWSSPSMGSACRWRSKAPSSWSKCRARPSNFREMIMIALRRVVVAVMLVALAGTAVAQDRPGRGGGDRPNRQEQSQQGGADHEQSSPGVLSLLPADAVSEHSIDTPSGKLAYTATAGTFSLFNQSGDRSAAVFYTAYVAKTDNHAARPLTFVFNGGPGATSAWSIIRTPGLPSPIWC